MRILYMGTPEFAVPALERIYASHHSIAGVVTGPDRPRGRGHKLHPTPVASRAVHLNLPVLKPDRVKAAPFLTGLREIEIDAVVLVAFGQLIPPEILSWPPLGCVNLHPSLLPRYRGAGPIHAPLLNGDDETGVTTMFMDEGLDTGDIILQRHLPIGAEENAGDLHDRLARLGADLLVETLDALERGDAPRIPQDPAQATYAPKVQKEQIDWNQPAPAIVRRIRGLSPYPGTFTHLEGRRVKVLRATVREEAPSCGPGRVVALTDDGPLVSASDAGSVLLMEVQPEGKAPMSGVDFGRGYRPEPGTPLS